MQRDSNTKWNFAVITLDAALFIGALAFADPIAVLPVFIRTLTDSTVVIGLLGTLQRAGWLLPQLAVASMLHHRPRKKPFLLLFAISGRLPFFFLAVVVFLKSESNPALVLWALMLCFSAFWLTDGMAGITWHDIIGKAIPANVRGRLFGAQQFIGAGIAVLAGYILKVLLAENGIGYPTNYAILFFIVFIGLLFSGLALAFLKEPIRPVASERKSILQLLKMTPLVLREKPSFRRMIATQIVGSISLIAVPFYVIYAETRLGAPAWTSGIFVWAGTLGGIIASFIWAYLSDRHGSTKVIKAVCLLAFITPATAIFIAYLKLSAPFAYYAYSIVFALNVCIMGGTWVGFTNFLLEIVNDEERIGMIGIANTLLMPIIFMPAIGGWMLNFLEYEIVFAIASASGLATWIIARGLIEPRFAKRAEGEAQEVLEASIAHHG